MNKKPNKDPWTHKGCLSVIIIFLAIFGFFIYGFFDFWSKESKKENTTILINKAPQIFKEYSGLDIPSNVEVKYGRANIQSRSLSVEEFYKITHWTQDIYKTLQSI